MLLIAPVSAFWCPCNPGDALMDFYHFRLTADDLAMCYHILLKRLPGFHEGLPKSPFIFHI